MQPCRGDRGGLSYRGGVRNGGSWWPRGGLEVAGLWPFVAASATFTGGALTGVGEERWAGASCDGAEDELLVWWSSAALLKVRRSCCSLMFFRERGAPSGEREKTAMVEKSREGCRWSWWGREQVDFYVNFLLFVNLLPCFLNSPSSIQSPLCSDLCFFFST